MDEIRSIRTEKKAATKRIIARENKKIIEIGR